MKLSKKGQIKLNDFLYAYGAYVSGLRANAPDPLEFEPSDFKGCVVLSSKEAHRIRWAMNPAPEDCIWRKLLEERIKQAEKEYADN